MKKDVLSVSAIESFIEDALKGYLEDRNNTRITDIHLQVEPNSGRLLVLNDDDIIMSETIVEEWKNKEEVYIIAEPVIRNAVLDLLNSNKLECLDLVKPYSFVLIDESKETIAELLLVDDQDILFLNEGLLEGLDDELNEFLKGLLEM